MRTHAHMMIRAPLAQCSSRALLLSIADDPQAPQADVYFICFCLQDLESQQGNPCTTSWPIINTSWLMIETSWPFLHPCLPIYRA